MPYSTQKMHISLQTVTLEVGHTIYDKVHLFCDNHHGFYGKIIE